MSQYVYNKHNTIGKCFVRYVRTRCFCIRNLTRSLRSLVRYLIRQQLVRKYRTPALSMKYSLFIYNIHIYTVPQVKSKTICFSSLTYISTVLNGLHQGEWPLQASHTISDLWYDRLGPGTRTSSTAVFRRETKTFSKPVTVRGRVSSHSESHQGKCLSKNFVTSLYFSTAMKLFPMKSFCYFTIVSSQRI